MILNKYIFLKFLTQEFRRDGSDLHMVQRIGLVEALCGFQIIVTHLDGRQLLVKYPPGKVIEPGKHVLIQHVPLFITILLVCLVDRGLKVLGPILD